MMPSDESGMDQPAQPSQPAETPAESQRNLPHLLVELAVKVGDGAAVGAGTYLGKKAMEKVFGGKDKGGGQPEPPAKQPPPPAE
jgi:hypothetical protein